MGFLTWGKIVRISIGLESTSNGLEIFWLFNIAWVYQAIERHAMLMAFHPSTNLGIGDMISDAHARQTDILYPYMHTYLHIRIYTCTSKHYIHVYTHTNTGLDDSIHTVLLCIYIHMLPHMYKKNQRVCIVAENIYILKASINMHSVMYISIL